MGSTGEQIAAVNGVELCWEAFGERSDPALVLAHGAGDSMLVVARGLLRAARRGRAVRRPLRQPRRGPVDHATSRARRPTRPQDVVADAAALIDALGLEPASTSPGLSGGGAFAQLLALDYPEKVATLTLLSTTPGDPGTEAADLPGPTQARRRASFSGEGGEPDWADRDAVVEYLVELERPFAGSGGFDEEAQRELAGRSSTAPTTSPRCSRTRSWSSTASRWRWRLGEITAPTLVIHGDDDPLFPLEHGQALAREIPDAELLVLEGVGHEYPPPRTWDTVVPAILQPHRALSASDYRAVCRCLRVTRRSSPRAAAPRR